MGGRSCTARSLPSLPVTGHRVLGEHLECLETQWAVSGRPLCRKLSASAGHCLLLEVVLKVECSRRRPAAFLVGAGTSSAVKAGETSCREARATHPAPLGGFWGGRRCLAGHTQVEESAFWRPASASSVPPSAYLLPKASSFLPLRSSSPSNNKLEAFSVGRDLSQFCKFKPPEE